MRGRIVVLEGVVDHTNVGAVFRSAAGLGFDGVLVDPTCADPLYRRSVRVSMGAVFALPWTRIPAWPAQLTDLAAAGWEIMALTPRPDAEALPQVAADPPPRLALLLGSEGPRPQPRGPGCGDPTRPDPDVRWGRLAERCRRGSGGLATRWETRPGQ